MVVAVVVSMEGSLKNSIDRVAGAIRKAKALINDQDNCIVYGPHFGKSGGKISAVQYRVSNSVRCIDPSSQIKLWSISPDELVQG